MERLSTVSPSSWHAATPPASLTPKTSELEDKKQFKSALEPSTSNLEEATVTTELSEPPKKAQGTSQKAILDRAVQQVSGEVIAEIKQLVMRANPEQLKGIGGDFRRLDGIDKNVCKATLEVNDRLLQAFRSAYNRLSKGGKDFPADFSSKLISEFESRTMKSEKLKRKQEIAPTENSKATGKTRKVNKLSLDQIPGLQDMFLNRAINHLVTGELHKLDPMVGDESCQSRTPFILDMYRLLQENMEANAAELVCEYREKTDDEQRRLLKNLEALQLSRKNKNPNYESSVSDFIGSNPLKASIEAKSGEYEAMLKSLVSIIQENDPEYVEYLSYACSEASIYWEDVLDPFGILMLSYRHPIFPNKLLSKRKMVQSRLSKGYMVQVASELVKTEGCSVITVEKEIGFDTKGTMITSPSFFVAQSKKDKIVVMLLHALQLHSGAAVMNRKRLELVPYWETTRLALVYALKQGNPLIVNLSRLIVSGDGNDRQYSSNICKTLFYEPTDEGYQYQPNPSEEQQFQGALLFQGYSILRKGDTNIPGATLPIAPWVFKEDQVEFLDGFTKCDVANLMLLGDVGTHHPLNTGGSGSGTYAYGLPGGPGCIHSFEEDPGGWQYVNKIHELTLSDLNQDGMTQQGLEYLTPEFELSDKSKGLLFPDQLMSS